MSKKSLLCLATIAPVLLAGSLWAQTTAPPQPGATESASLSGTVVSRSDSSIVIKTGEGMEMTFVVDSRNVIPPGISAGDRIDVTYDVLTDGTFRASEVSLFTPPGAAPASSAAPAPAAADPPAGERAATSLPRTGSSQPMMVLVGILALAFATGAWLLTKCVSS